MCPSINYFRPASYLPTAVLRLKQAAIGAGGLLVPWCGSQRAYAQGLPPLTIPKYVTGLVIPPAMPRTSVTPDGIDYYEIALRRFQQNILPASMGKPTTVWSYGSLSNVSGTLNYPAFTIEARVGRPVRVKWVNQLVDANGRYLPHLLPVDPTLHWANPVGPVDERPAFSSTPGPYRGPVPMVVHLHGGHSAFG